MIYKVWMSAIPVGMIVIRWMLAHESVARLFGTFWHQTIQFIWVYSKYYTRGQPGAALPDNTLEALHIGDATP